MKRRSKSSKYALQNDAHSTLYVTSPYGQMHCDVQLADPTTFVPERMLKDDKFYRFTEKTWMWQQLPWALLLFLVGDWAWVVWGICVRVAVCVTGHWLIGYFAHRTGRRDWHVEGAGVQGYNIKFTGLITFGECWHNNHHAFPGSANLGLKAGQFDPGWWVLKFFQRLGLVWGLKTPESLPQRKALVSL